MMDSSTHLNEADQNTLEAVHSSNGTSNGFLLSLVNYIKAISIEPIMFFYFFGESLTLILTTNLLLERVCLLDFNGTDAECNNLSSNADLENDVVKRTAEINLYIQLLTCLPAIILVPLMGAYSDLYGRKIPMMLPLSGYFVTTLCTMVFSMVPEAVPLWTLGCNVPKAMTGGMALLLMACYSYISDNSDNSARTGRMAFVVISFALGAPCGLLLSSVLFQRMGYWPVYATGAGLLLITIVYTAVRIRNRPIQPSLERQGEQSWVVQCITGGLDTLQTCFKQRPGFGRARILLPFLAIIFIVISFEVGNFTLLFTKKVLNWNYTAFVNYIIFSLLIEIAGSCLLLYTFGHLLMIPDVWLGLGTACFKVPSYFLNAFTRQTSTMYIASCVSSFNLVPMIVTRSILSKSVSSAELGKVFSLLSVTESVLPLMTSPAYTVLFKYTIDWLPGAVYLLSAGACAMMVMAFLSLAIIDCYAGREEPPFEPLPADQ